MLYSSIHIPECVIVGGVPAKAINQVGSTGYINNPDCPTHD